MTPETKCKICFDDLVCWLCSLRSLLRTNRKVAL